MLPFSRDKVHPLEATGVAQAAQGLLRFMTCGSVDDGKSTLIGRLLWDSKLVSDDQLATLESESKTGGDATWPNRLRLAHGWTASGTRTGHHD